MQKRSWSMQECVRRNNRKRRRDIQRRTRGSASRRRRSGSVLSLLRCIPTIQPDVRQLSTLIDSTPGLLEKSQGGRGSPCGRPARLGILALVELVDQDGRDDKR